MDNKQMDLMVRIYNQLLSEFAEPHETMNRIYYYCVPERYNLKDANPEFKKTLPKDIYDSTMFQAQDIFSSGIHGYLMNQSSRWFALETLIKKQMELPGVRRYFQEVEEILYSILDSSNFYYESREAVTDLAAGNAVLYGEENETHIVNFTSIVPTTCVWTESSTGRVNGLYRKFNYTVSQMIEKFGEENCSKKVVDLYKAGKLSDRLDVIHCARPRWQRDRSKIDNINKQFESVYFEYKQRHLLSESGYDYFPYFVIRYIKNSGQVVGYGPGDFALPDAKMLNEAMKNEILAQQLDVDPVKSVPSSGFLLPILSGPGSINYRVSDNIDDRIEYLRSGANHQANEIFMDKCRDRINSAFHKDFFLAISDATKRMTIPEVQERIAEKMPMLGSGSGIARVMSEGLSPIVDFVYSIAAKRGILPELPEELQDSTYKTVFVSPLAKAQRVSEIRGLQSTVQSATVLGQISAETLDNYDFDAIAREGNDIMGGKATFLREIKDRDRIRAERRAAQEEQAQKQELLMLAQAAETSTNADVNIAKAEGRK